MKSKCRICCRSRQLVTLGWLIVLAAASPATAQYIYLDTNNDGVNTWADSLNSSGNTAVDVWLDTGSNADGSPGFCGAAGFSSYEFILKTTGGGVNWGTWIPVRGTNVVFTASSASEYHTAMHSNGGGDLAATTPLGRYKLGTLNVGVSSGNPCMQFGTSTALSARFATSFGSRALMTTQPGYFARRAACISP